MASTYTTNAGIELIATGEQSGTWGDTTNTNLQIIDRLTNGVGAISLSGTTHTLTTSDGTLSDGQYAVLVFGGTPSGTNTVTISPNTGDHLYVVKNNSGESVILTQGSGGNVTIADGKSAIVYADGAGAGAEVVDVTSTFDFQAASAALTAIAALATTDGNIIVGNGTTWVAENGNTAIASLGITSTAAELNLVDGSAAGTIVNSKAVVYGASGEVNATTLQIAGTSITASAVELNYNDITTLGTSEASKAVTTDANGVTIFDGGVVEDDTTITSTGGAATINCRDGNVFSHTLSEDVTYTFSNAPASGRAFAFTLKVVQDSTARTITWPASVDWPAATAPTLSSGSGDVDVFVFFTTDGGTTWYGFTAGQDLS